MYILIVFVADGFSVCERLKAVDQIVDQCFIYQCSSLAVKLIDASAHIVCIGVNNYLVGFFAFGGVCYVEFDNVIVVGRRYRFLIFKCGQIEQTGIVVMPMPL